MPECAGLDRRKILYERQIFPSELHFFSLCSNTSFPPPDTSLTLWATSSVPHLVSMLVSPIPRTRVRCAAFILPPLLKLGGPKGATSIATTILDALRTVDMTMSQSRDILQWSPEDRYNWAVLEVRRQSTLYFFCSPLTTLPMMIDHPYTDLYRIFADASERRFKLACRDTRCTTNLGNPRGSHILSIPLAYSDTLSALIA